MPLSVDTKNHAAAAAFVQARFRQMHPRASGRFLRQLFAEVTALFTGKHPDYLANDLRYHDFEHTLQATVCLAQLLAGRHAAKTEPRFTARQTELAIASALLHDSGYLRHHSDTHGTGAKYTFMHVLRSCAFAATYLPTLKVSLTEINGGLSAIRCTGPTSRIVDLNFASDVEPITGCALATADYLGQMAAADYPDELDFLHAEFTESYDYFNVPRSERMFKSARALKENTANFWRKLVQPKLENDFNAVYPVSSPRPQTRQTIRISRLSSATLPRSSSA